MNRTNIEKWVNAQATKLLIYPARRLTCSAKWWKPWWETSCKQWRPNIDPLLVRIAVRLGADVNVRFPTAYDESYGRGRNYYTTALHRIECPDTVQLLIDNGADVDAPDDHGNSPLFGASASKTRVLLDNGAYIGPRGEDGRTALESARRRLDFVKEVGMDSAKYWQEIVDLLEVEQVRRDKQEILAGIGERANATTPTRKRKM